MGLNSKTKNQEEIKEETKLEQDQQDFNDDDYEIINKFDFEEQYNYYRDDDDDQLYNYIKSPYIPP